MARFKVDDWSEIVGKARQTAMDYSNNRPSPNTAAGNRDRRGDIQAEVISLAAEIARSQAGFLRVLETGRIGFIAALSVPGANRPQNNLATSVAAGLVPEIEQRLRERFGGEVTVEEIARQQVGETPHERQAILYLRFLIRRIDGLRNPQFFDEPSQTYDYAADDQG